MKTAVWVVVYFVLLLLSIVLDICSAATRLVTAQLDYRSTCGQLKLIVLLCGICRCRQLFFRGCSLRCSRILPHTLWLLFERR